MITVAWNYEDDAPYRRTATDLQRHVGSGWLVFWGPGSRRFWAFLRGGPHPLILSRPKPQELYDLVRQHERSFSTHQDRRGGAADRARPQHHGTVPSPRASPASSRLPPLRHR